MADARTYIKVHDGMPEHPKIVGLSDKAFRALVELWCYCGRNLTDGEVRSAIAGKYGRKAVTELEKEGLLESLDADWYMHDYLEHQRSASEVASLKRSRSEAGSRGGRAKAASDTANAMASAIAKGKQNGGKSLADTDTDTEELLRSSLVGSEIAVIRADVENVCSYLADAIAANGSKRPAVTTRWRDAARRLIDLDGRTEDQIRRAIDFSQRDEFWRANVLSMPKLREKYDQLRLAAQRGGPTSRQAGEEAMYGRWAERAANQ